MNTSTRCSLKLKWGDVTSFIDSAREKGRHLFRFFFSSGTNTNVPSQVRISWGDAGKAIVFLRNPNGSLKHKYVVTKDGAEISVFRAQGEMEETGVFSLGSEFYKKIGKEIADSDKVIDTLSHILTSLTQQGLTAEVTY